MIMIDLMSVRFGIVLPPDVQIVVGYRDDARRCKACVGEWVQSQNLLILTPPAGVF